MTMLEDYWLPRREGGRGTEVTTLPGGQTLGQMDDVLYFQKKFLNSLNVPVSRLNSDALFSVGRATEITRDELKFTKFTSRLRGRFSHLFTKMLEKQLVLKGICTLEEWKFFSDDIRFDFAKDNYFTELKEAEILEGRINQARNIQDMVGKYYSHEWVRKNVLHQSDDDVVENDKAIQLENQLAEQGDYKWVNPTVINNEMLLQQAEMQTQQMQMSQDQQQQLQPGTEGSMGGDPEMAQKMEQVRTAQIIVDQMKKMPKANRTMADEAKYKAAVQVLAKNPELVSRAQAGGAPQQTQQ
jgi:hypothetical protein